MVLSLAIFGVVSSTVVLHLYPLKVASLNCWVLFMMIILVWVRLLRVLWKKKKKLILVWNIWNHRNEVLFKGKTINSFAAINNITKDFSEIRDTVLNFVSENYISVSFKCSCRVIDLWMRWHPSIFNWS